MIDSSANASFVVEAERRYRRVNRLFWLFVAVMPLGVVIPCVASIAAYQIWGDTVSAPIGFSALFCPLIGLAGALLIRGSRRRVRRSLELARLAATWGMQFRQKASPEVCEMLKSMSLMANPHTQMGVNQLESVAGNHRITTLDYEYRYFYGAVNIIGWATIVVYHGGFDRLPQMAVVPLGVMAQIENALLGKGDAIKFPHDPEFDRRFAVVGNDPQSILACLSPPLFRTFKNDPLLTLLSEDGRLLFYRRQTYVRPSEYGAFLAEVHHIAEWLAKMT